MKNLKIISMCILVCTILLGGGLASVKAEAAELAPSETDPFVKNYYIGETDQDAPFFDVVLPQIAKNIEENNTHTISPYYDKFPLANNPENFQGLGSTTYASINGKTVTAEAFYRVRNESLNDPNNGMGLLIYQCIQYKRAHPDEDVKITFSSYRTSVTASVCVLPESKYYGYMRSLYGTNYDEHGFVRISYMLTEAARMGIEVTLVNQLPSYAVKQYNPETGKLASRSHLDFHTYYTKALKTECYDTYAPGKKVSDFMDYVKVGWNVTDKTSDMQHCKSCTVSHYLATDGTEHENAVFFSSSNLDENSYIGANGNNGSQSGVIISDHAELYRVTYNYMKLMSEYRELEELFELRRILNTRNNEQIALIRSGRGDEIPADEQIVYLGTEEDPVFELYFTPFGGSPDSWDTAANPICKYVEKLPQSEDYVELIWNEFGYGKCYTGAIMSKMLEKAYCGNPNANNKISMRVTGFNTDAIQQLKVGSEIGYRSIKEGTNIHSKDIMLSYMEDGVRHRVSLLTSCNFYQIAFNSRTNSMLVIHETDETGGAFYNILGKKYSYGMLENVLRVIAPSSVMKVGESQTLIADYSGTKTLTWKSSDSSIATVKDGTVVAVRPGTVTITATDGDLTEAAELTVISCPECARKTGGQTFNIDEQFAVMDELPSVPMSMEAVFTVDKADLTGNATLFGCDGSFDPAMTFYLNKNGNPCVMVRPTAHNSKKNTYVFGKVNVATGKQITMTIAINSAKQTMHCFVDGEWAQSLTGITAIPDFEMKHNFLIGGDHLNGNATYFPGEIESVAVWSDVRTSSEVAADYGAGGIDFADTNLMAAYDLTMCETCMRADKSENGHDLERVVLWQDKDDVESVGQYDYAFAVVGDTQTMNEDDPEAMEALYDWILENKEEQKIEYMIGLGDITDNSTDAEWEHANAYIGKLNGEVPYTLVRGNHDDLDDFNSNLHNGFYETTVDGLMNEDDLTNSYRCMNIHGTDYMFLTLDFAPSEAVLEWADEVIEAHPDHRVIAVTHAYMYRDGTTIDDGDCYPPTYYSGYVDAQNGDDMWEKCFSKHENVVMVLSGHDPWQHIVYRQDEGENGNTVTQMLIDPQYMDRYIGSTAMVAMFYFSDGGDTLTVRYYSVVKDCYGSEASQFTINLT